MSDSRLRWIVLFLAIAPACCGQADRELVIRSASVIDGQSGSVRDRVTVVVEEGRIKSIGSAAQVKYSPGARVLEGRGRWVIPGLVDAHSHYGGAVDMRRYLALGVTTIYSMPVTEFGYPARAAEIENPSNLPGPPSPRVQLSVLFARGFPDTIWPGLLPWVKPADAGAARQKVRDANARGFRHIKIVLDDGRRFDAAPVPRLEPEVFEALIREAHRLGMRVQVHVTQLGDMRQAIKAGADSLVHSVYSEVVDDATWELMRARRIAWVPSLGVMMANCEPKRYAELLLAEPAFIPAMTGKKRLEMKNLAGSPPAAAAFPWKAISGAFPECRKTAARNIQRARRLGVTIAVGSDTLPAGANQHLEMLFLQEAGMTPAGVLSAGTYGGAVAIGTQGESARLRVGAPADLVVLRANPVADIRNARQIEWIVKGGRRFSPAELLSALK
jgi:imidazolonepropionase-like amidohydrolase